MHLRLMAAIQEFFRNISAIHLLPIYCHRLHTMLNMHGVFYLNGKLAAAIEPFHCSCENDNGLSFEKRLVTT